MMIKPRKNSFYKKQQIDSSSAIKLNALFKDASLYENEIMTLEGGTSASKFVLSGSIPTQPTYGEGVLDGAKLVLFCSGSDLSSLGTMPLISSYKLKEDVTLTEGNMSFSTSGAGGQKVSIYTSYADKVQPYLAETMDGIPKDLGGNVKIVGSDGTGAIVFEDPFMEPSAAARVIYLGGTYSVFHMGDEAGGSGESGDFLKFYFGDGNGNIPIKPMSKNKITGKWTVKLDRRTGYAVYTVFKPIWRWNDIKGLLSFSDSYSSVPSDFVTPTPLNTFFTVLHKTPDNSTAYSGDSEGNPWAYSDLDMSSEEFLTGGQSLHMAHSWDVTSDTSIGDTLYGTSGQVNEQYACAAGEVLPYPIPLDYTLITTSGARVNKGPHSPFVDSPNWDSAISADPAVIAGDGLSGMLMPSSLVKPELDISFKITKMDAALKLYSPDPQELRVFDWIGFSGTTGASGSGYSYTGQNALAGFTMLRAFTICLSSYAPNPGESLNGFIDRGMTEFYTNQNYKDGIVGGMSFLRFIDNETSIVAAGSGATASDNADVIVACPLLTRASAYRASGGYQGMGKGDSNPTQRMFRAISGQNADAGTDASMIMHTYTAFPVAQGFNRASHPEAYGGDSTEHNNGRAEPTVALTLNEWINMKIVFDPLGENLGAQPGLARAYFTEGAWSQTTENLTQKSTYDKDKPPSTHFYFPAMASDAYPLAVTSNYPYVNSTNLSGGTWNWVDHPEYWPKFLSLWLTNYRYASSTENILGLRPSTTESVLIGEYPVDVGTAKESEVFIDSVTLTNFTNETLNNSAGAAYLTKPISIRDRPVNNYLDAFGNLMFPESAGQGAISSSAIGNYHAPTYVSFGFENGVTDLQSRFDTSGTYDADGEAGAHMLWSGFSTPTFENLERQDQWTTHASFIGTDTGVTEYDSIPPTGATNRLGFWHANRGTLSAVTYATGSPTHYSGSGALRLANANARNNKLKLVFDNTGVSGTQGGYNYAGGFQMATGSYNTFLSTDGMTQKGFMKFITSGMVASVSGNGRWIKTVNPLVSAKIIGLPDFEESSINSFFSQRAVIVDNTEIFNERTLGDTQYMIYTASGGILTDAQLIQTPGVAGKRSNILSQEKVKEENVIFFSEDLPEDLVNAVNLPYLYVSPMKYWINMETYPGKQLTVTGTAKDTASYRSGSTGADKVFDGMATMTATDDASIITSTGSTYNEQLFFYNSGARAQAGRSQVYGNPWELDPGDPITTSLVTSEDYGFGAFKEEDQTGGQAAVETVFQDKQLVLNYDKAIETWSPAPQTPFGVTIELHQPAVTHTITLYGNDFTGTDNAQLKPYFAYQYLDELPALSKFSIEPALNLLEVEDLYELPEESRNAVRFSWDLDGDDLWYSMLHVSSGSISNKYHSSFMWAPLNEQPLTPTGAATYKWYNVGAGRSTPKPSGDFTISGGTLLQTIDGMAGYAPLFAEDGYLSVSSLHVSSSTGGEGLDSLNEFTVVVHATPNGAPAGRNYYYLQNTGSISSGSGGGFAIWMDQIGTVHAQMGIASGTTHKATQGHMQSISTNTMDGTTPLSVMVSYNSGSLTGPDFKLFVNGVLEDYVRTGVSNPTCTGTNIYIGSGCLGTVEEVIAYDTEVYMPQTQGEHFFDTSDLLDKQSDGKAINYQARLFAMDYHNIRGEDPMQVARSKPVSWRVSSI